MPKINVLEKHVAELIAAGEVIERPASIVKELMENAIDAGATAVTVEIKNGGIRYLRVTDNGCGISREDVPTAFLRHATSKVRYEYDLESIGTLGFRGEALASICAVSKVEMLTKTAEEQFGTRIELAGGEQLSCEEAGCPDGTTIVVRDLFYNVPARLKFLKRDLYEAGLVAGIVDKIALSNPQVSVKLIKENKVELHTPGDGQILSAIYAVFGKEFAKTLLPVDYTYQNIHVTGMTSIPELSRANRKSQHFFVNSRYVKSRTCAGALEEAYRGSIMVGKFPACVLYLEVPNDTIDVNVHPTKTEIRFTEEKTAYEAVLFAVRSAISARNQQLLKDKQANEQILSVEHTPSAPTLDYATKAQELLDAGEQKQFSVTKSLSFDGYSIELEQPEPCIAQPESGYFVVEREEREPVLPSAAEPELKQSDLKYLDLSKIMNAPPSEKSETAPSVPIPQEELSKPQAESEQKPLKSLQEDITPKIKLCGEVFKTYILAEIDDHFLMIDKHAAHERILYEKLRSSHGDLEGQFLLTPMTLTLSREDYMTLLEHKETLLRYGFEIDDFGQCSIQMRSIPSLLDTADAVSVLYELSANLRKNKKDISPEQIDDILHSMACKAAIKANSYTGEQELLALVKEVYQNDAIRYCPHGRPVVITMTKYELEKKFHRVV